MQFKSEHPNRAEELRKHFKKEVKPDPQGRAVLRWSCLGANGQFKFLQCMSFVWNGKKPKRGIRAVEIGTYRGVGTSIIAEQCGSVVTFDIRDEPLRFKVWELFGVADRIRSVILPTTDFDKGDRMVADMLSKIEFDMAFIDGHHSYESAKANFEAVRKCGRVIFHDYKKPQFKDRVVKAVDEIVPKHGGELFVMEPFAAWRA